MSARKHPPQRTCLACRTAADKHVLLRYVLTPTGEIIVDYRQKLPGRGAYTCCKTVCVEQTLQRKGFQRAFRNNALNVDAAELMNSLRQILQQRLVNLLGMVRKSGRLLIGANQVEDALRHKKPLGLIVVAVDATSSTCERLSVRAQQTGVEIIRLMDKLALGALCGKSQTSAVGLVNDDLTATILSEITRFREFEVH